MAEGVEWYLLIAVTPVIRGVSRALRRIDAAIEFRRMSKRHRLGIPAPGVATPSRPQATKWEGADFGSKIPVA